jgi:hypothetical protein
MKTTVDLPYPRDGFMERLAQLASDLKIQAPGSSIFRLPWFRSKGAPAGFGRTIGAS